MTSGASKLVEIRDKISRMRFACGKLAHDIDEKSNAKVLPRMLEMKILPGKISSGMAFLPGVGDSKLCVFSALCLAKRLQP